MKRLLTFLFTIFLCSAASSGFAQCTGRYYDEVFSGPTFTTVVPGVGQIPDLTKLGGYSIPFGSAEGQTLDMYVFEPEGDEPGNQYYEEKRPLVVLAYGGSFTAGIRESPDIINLCQTFTKRGFVTASIEYRLNTGTIDSATMLKQVVKAVQDAKAAIRYFYKDAATTNTYRIDTNKIFMGGTSAGAFIGVHLGYLTDTAGIQQWMKEIIESQGDLEGNSGNPGYSSRVAGIINLAGAIGDTAWIKPGAVPMVSMHGNDDGTVPYCSDIISVSGNPLIMVDGSGTIKRRTSNLGITNRFYTWRDAGHVPYVDPRPTTEGPVYMDTTVWFVRDFLYEQMTGIRCDSALWATGNMTTPHVYQGGTLVACGPEIVDPTDDKAFNQAPTGIAPFVNVTVEAYPNPSSDAVTITKPVTLQGSADALVYDNLGKLVKTYHAIPDFFTISRNELGTGLFIVKILPANKSLGMARAKVVFE